MSGGEAHVIRTCGAAAPADHRPPKHSRGGQKYIRESGCALKVIKGTKLGIDV